MNKLFIISLIILLILLFSIIINSLINNIFSHKNLQNIKGSHYVYIDGLRINYVKKGHGEPLLLIHGLISSINIFQDLIDSLSKYNTVLALDLIGFGLSEKGDNLNYNLKNMSELALKLMEHESFHSFNVLGHSMGGEVALNLAYYYPNHINKLILVGSLGYLDIHATFPITKSPSFILKFLLKIMIKNYYLAKLCFSFIFFNKKNFGTKIFDRVYTSILKNLSLETLYNFTLNYDSGKLCEKIKFISTNTLIVWGRNDILVPLKYGQQLNKDIKNSKLIILDDCGHVPFVERPEAFTTIMRKFL